MDYKQTIRISISDEDGTVSASKTIKDGLTVVEVLEWLEEAFSGVGFFQIAEVFKQEMDGIINRYQEEHAKRFPIIEDEDEVNEILTMQPVKQH